MTQKQPQIYIICAYVYNIQTVTVAKAQMFEILEGFGEFND